MKKRYITIMDIAKITGDKKTASQYTGILRDSHVARLTDEKSVKYDLDEAYVYVRAILVNPKTNKSQWRVNNLLIDVLKTFKSEIKC